MASPLDLTTIFFALLGGMLPAFLWLWFWLKEDKAHPEPKRIIAMAFLGGAVAVPAAFFFENLVTHYYAVGALVTIVLWAFIEEILKFLGAYVAALRRKENDEPVDNMIYLITAALGFAAVENALFLLAPLSQGGIADTLATGNLRFIGSTLLHVICSSIIGIALAYSFCKTPGKKALHAGVGVILAALLHTLFNFFILNTENNLFLTFGVVWVLSIVLFLFFEKVKRLNRTCVY
ncbi:MAG TPA: PrsW family intramembrane metalloprotease [Candidatus Paceibacterota bacterium]|nr:PrsW family intramembrane metalloprotease [Candidatus Paceibacterota bacterium]